MATPYPYTYFDDSFVPSTEATISVASSAVLYGLSVYTVFHVAYADEAYFAFRLKEHYERLQNSCKVIGIDTFASEWSFKRFTQVMAELLAKNAAQRNVFVRVSFHVVDILPGTRSRGLPAILSAFVYDAEPIIPQTGVRLKTSVWRRNPDYSIPSRAKVNGAYVNSVLARQDAIDSGYDDCIFLDNQGHVAELSAANIFLVRNNTLITPSASADILEGINRRTILELASTLGIQTHERPVDLTELYIADEAFVCGTSAFVTPVINVDNRPLELPQQNSITARLSAAYKTALLEPHANDYLTRL